MAVRVDFEPTLLWYVLTKRQREIVAAMRWGTSSKGLSGRLGIIPESVDRQMATLYDRVEAAGFKKPDDRYELWAMAFKPIILQGEQVDDQDS